MITPIISQDYRDTRLPSYSLLSSLDAGRLGYVKDYIQGSPLEKYEKKRSKARAIGSYVDALLFYNTDYIENNFYILSSSYSEGLYTKFVDHIVAAIYDNEALREEIPDTFNLMSTFFTNINTRSRSLLLNAYTLTGFKLGYEAVFTKIHKEYLQLMFEKLKAHNKTTLSVDEALISDNTATELKNGPYTAQYFKESPHTIFLTQAGFSFNFKRRPGLTRVVKMLPDIIEINVRDKWIRGVDVKTKEGSAYNFRYDFLKWRYYLQSALYTEGLRAWLESAQEKGNYSGYTINTKFRFVVGSTDVFNSCIFECTPADIELGLEGFIRKDGTVVRGVNQLMFELDWHIEHNYWVTPHYIFKSDGVQQLNLLDKL